MLCVYAYKRYNGETLVLNQLDALNSQICIWNKIPELCTNKCTYLY